MEKWSGGRVGTTKMYLPAPTLVDRPAINRSVSALMARPCARGASRVPQATGNDATAAAFAPDISIKMSPLRTLTAGGKRAPAERKRHGAGRWRRARHQGKCSI